ncbi:MAG: hypothetical protein WD017_07250, partial [Cucumibacter sp.]
VRQAEAAARLAAEAEALRLAAEALLITAPQPPPAPFPREPSVQFIEPLPEYQPIDLLPD